MKRLLCGFVSLLFLAGGAVAQNSDAQQPPSGWIRIQREARLAARGMAGEPLTWMFQQGGALQGGSEGNVVFFSAEMAGNEVIKDAPYSATATTESTQTLADGNRIVHKTSTFQARDSQGRTRREESVESVGPLAVNSPKLVLITDPVAHADYILQPAQQTARLIKRDESADVYARGLRRKVEITTKERGLEPKDEKASVKIAITTKERALEPKEENATVKREDLGTQEIEGLACQGRRETVTIPAGQQGNELPIVISTEVWTSEDLHGVVLKKHTDPRFGETVYRVTNIKLGEPEPSLFQVPANYKTTTIGIERFTKE